MARTFILGDLARRVGGRVEGDEGLELAGLRTLEEAGPRDLAFLGNARYRRAASASRAGALLTSPPLAPAGPRPLLVVDEPYLALSRLVPVFYPEPPAPAGVSDRAVVAPDARLGEGVFVGPLAVVGSGCRIGARVRIHAGVIVGDGCEIGDDSVLHPGCSVYPGTRIGRRVIVHGGTVLGSDGFGFATSGGKHHKVPQVGRLIVEDDVEIGANVTVDRGSLGQTVIGAGSKIDNLVQIAHNVRLGRDSLVVAQAGIAGSTRSGRGLVLAGQSGTAGHLTLGDGVVVASKSAVYRDLPDGAAVAGIPAVDHRVWKRSQAAFPRLPGLLSKLRSMLSRLEKLESRFGGKE